jgi:aspartate carbamoyltransferase catalytic subunit
MFFQPSTRTRLGFESAALRLGARVTGFADPTTTRSVDYIAESFEDSVRVVSELTDVIVIRHHIAGAGRRAAAVARVPIVNGGDGSNEHPTQALADAWLMHRRLGGLDGAVVGLVGDPGTRVFRSLVLVLVRLGVSKVLFLVPPNLPLDGRPHDALLHTTLPGDVRAMLDRAGVGCEFRNDVTDLLIEADAIEMMPVEVPALEADPASLRKRPYTTPERFRITAAKMVSTASKALILHPGPRRDELHPDVDELPNGLYFEQISESLFMRMAVLAALVTPDERRFDP